MPVLTNKLDWITEQWEKKLMEMPYINWQYDNIGGTSTCPTNRNLIDGRDLILLKECIPLQNWQCTATLQKVQNRSGRYKASVISTSDGKQG